MDVKQIARGLQRSRVQNGFKSNFTECFAEASFLEQYKRQPNIDELRTYGDKQSLAPVTEDGIVIGLIVGKGSDIWEVSVDRLDVDILVFTSASVNDADFYGWLPVNQVEECRVLWEEDENGRRTSYSHIVAIENTFNMPSELVFDASCDRTCNESGIWDYRLECWECFFCGRFRPNAADREYITEADTRLLAETAEGNEKN